MENVTNNKILPYLSTQAPLGEEIVRFKRKLAVQITPTSSFYTLFFNPKIYDAFKKQLTQELQGLKQITAIDKNNRLDISQLTPESFGISYDDAIDIETFVKKIEGSDRKLIKNLCGLRRGQTDFPDFKDFIEYFNEQWQEINGHPSPWVPWNACRAEIASKVSSSGISLDMASGRIHGNVKILMDKLIDPLLGKLSKDVSYHLDNMLGKPSLKLKYSISFDQIGSEPHAKISEKWKVKGGGNDINAFVDKIIEKIELAKDNLQNKKFLSQSISVSLDERINSWYRGYKNAMDEIKIYERLILEYDRERNYRIDSGTENSEKNEYRNIFRAGNDDNDEALQADQRATKAQDLIKFEEEYDGLHTQLYAARDRKMAIIRKIRTEGYELNELYNDENFGYDFVILKGEPDYKEIPTVNYGADIIPHATDATTAARANLLNFIDELSYSNVENIDLGKIKLFFTDNWSDIKESFIAYAKNAEHGWPNQLQSSLEEHADRLDASDTEQIPASLTSYKQTEKFLTEALGSNPFCTTHEDGSYDILKLVMPTEWQSLLDLEEQQAGKYEDAKGVLERLRTTIKYIRAASKPHKYPFMSQDEVDVVKNENIQNPIIWDRTEKYFEVIKEKLSLKVVDDPHPDGGEKTGDADGGEKADYTYPTVLEVDCLYDQGEVERYIAGYKPKRRRGGLFGGLLGSAISRIYSEVADVLGGDLGKLVQSTGELYGGRIVSRRAIVKQMETTPSQWMIHIRNNYPEELVWEGNDFIRVTKVDNQSFVVETGDSSLDKNPVLLNSATKGGREGIVIVFRKFIEDARSFCIAMRRFHNKNAEELKEHAESLRQKAESDKDALTDLQNYSLTRARINFLLHWKTPARFNQSGLGILENAISPDRDSWADLVNDLEPYGKYNPLGRKVQIDHFTFQRNGYYTQDGFSMRSYLELIKKDDINKGMRVAVFPAVDDYGLEVPGLRRAVINPAASYEPNPITRLPAIRFIEEHSVRLEWGGICLGELSHTENLAPNETKRITIEKKTNLTERLSNTYDSTDIKEMKTTTSFEEKLSSELNDKETYEEEQKRILEEKNEQEQRDKRVLVKNRTETSDSSLNLVGGYTGITVTANTKKNITKTRNDTKTNENILKDSTFLTTEDATKQGRETQTKDIQETIKKSSSETSQSNKVNIKRVSETEYSESATHKEEITISNNNVGKTINYYFFQLQNIYKTKHRIEDVRIIVDSTHEVIAKSGMTDIRVFRITDVAKIYEELGGDDESLLILAYIIWEYVLKNYYTKSGGAGLVANSQEAIFNEFAATMLNPEGVMAISSKIGVYGAGIKISGDKVDKAFPQTFDFGGENIKIFAETSDIVKISGTANVSLSGEISGTIGISKSSYLSLGQFTLSGKVMSDPNDDEKFSGIINISDIDVTDNKGWKMDVSSKIPISGKKVSGAFPEAVDFSGDATIEATFFDEVPVPVSSEAKISESGDISGTITIQVPNSHGLYLGQPEIQATLSGKVMSDLNDGAKYSGIINVSSNVSSAVAQKHINKLHSLLSKIKRTSLDFQPIEVKPPTGEYNTYTVNSGGLYMDTELGKKMATEPYLEARRDIETDLKRAEVEHLNAKTKAGVFYPPPNITPAVGGVDPSPNITPKPGGFLS